MHTCAVESYKDYITCMNTLQKGEGEREGEREGDRDRGREEGERERGRE